MATLLLIRHAEPAIRGTFLGQEDPPLSPAGHEQAKEALSGLKVNIAYVSPLRRAWETAAYLRSECVVLPELREIDFGEWNGRTWQQIQARWPALAREKTANWLEITPPSGESWTDFLNRVRAAWLRIRKGPTLAAVVAHAGVNAALAHLIDGRSPLHFQQRYTEVTGIEYGSDSRHDQEHSV
jgi:broad specificity phosphatase PhoE